MPKTIPNVTLICITTQHEQLVCHGYTSFKHAEDEMLDRIKRAVKYDFSTKYRRFIVVGTVGEVDGMHVYDKNGTKNHDQFI